MLFFSFWYAPAANGAVLNLQDVTVELYLVANATSADDPLIDDYEPLEA